MNAQLPDLPALKPGLRENWRYDLPAGLVVFLVALPLCLGIALASEAPLISGIITGVIAGTLVGFLSGSSLSVSGPAAGLTLIVAQGIKDCGSFEAMLCAGILAGVFQIILGLLRAGVFGEIFPNSVIKGMLAAIGVMIILKQIPHALGRDADYEGDLNFWLLKDGNTLTDIYEAVVSASPGAIMLCVISLAALIVWDSKTMKAQKWTKIIPGPLVAVTLGIVANEVLTAIAPTLAVTVEDGHRVSLPVFDSLAGLVTSLPRPDFSAFLNPAVIKTALVVGAVASIETLLSIEAVDKIDPYKRVSDNNRELVAQGVGNVIAGFVGGIPMTSVILRSSANVVSGGRTRISGIFHGILLMTTALLIPRVLNLIPLASLAAVLLMVGYKLARISLFKEMYASGWGQFLPFLVTVLSIVFSDILTGVFLGFVVGVVLVMKSNYYSAISVTVEGNDYLLRFTKDVSFINKIRLKRELAAIPKGASIYIEGSKANLIDQDIYEVLKDFEDSARYREITVTIRNVEGKQFTLERRTSPAPVK